MVVQKSKSVIVAFSIQLCGLCLAITLSACGGGGSNSNPAYSALTSSVTANSNGTINLRWVEFEDNLYIVPDIGESISSEEFLYQWKLNGAIIDQANTPFLQHRFKRGDVINLDIIGASSSLLISAENFVIPNSKPFIADPYFRNREVGTLDHIELDDVYSYDLDDDTLISSYQWFLNDVELPDQTNEYLPPQVAVYGDTVTVIVTVTDGIETASTAPKSITLIDTPPALVSDNNIEPIQYGTEYTGSAKFVDPDGQPVNTTLVSGPDGLSYDPANGSFFWQAAPLMFHDTESYQVYLKSDQGDSAVIKLIVTNPDHKPWLARSGTSRPIGITIGNFDNDSTIEMLSSDKLQRIFTTEFVNGELKQDWLYPYPTPDRRKIKQLLALENGKIVYITERSVTLIESRDKPPVIVYESEDSIYAAALDDIDLDGKKDFILSIEGGVLFLDPDTWELSSEKILLPQTDANYYYNVATGNLDEDPALEIVIGNGYVLDGATKEIQWTYISGFGVFKIADLNADGRNEIIGKKYSTSLTGYDAIYKSELYSLDTNSVCSFQTGNADNDTQIELIVGPCSGEIVEIYDVDGGTAVLQQEISSRPQGANPLSNFSSEHTSLTLADIDNDGIEELIFSADEYTFIAAVPGLGDNSPQAPYSVNEPGVFGVPYAVGWASIDNHKSAGVIVFPDTESRGAFTEDGQVIATLSDNGELSVGQASYSNWNDAYASALIDSNEDGVAEILVSVGDYYDGVLQHIRLDDFSLINERKIEIADDEPMAIEVSAVKKYPDLAVLAFDNQYVELFDIVNQTVIWRSPELPGELLGATAYVKSDELKILIRTYTETSIWRPNEDFYLREHTITSSCQNVVEFFDADEPLFGCISSDSIWSPRTLRVFNTRLEQQSEIEIDNIVNAVAAMPGGSLLLGIDMDDDSYSLSSSYKLMQIDPFTGNVVWESEPVLGEINELSVFDSQGAGLSRLLMSTNKAIYISQ